MAQRVERWVEVTPSQFTHEAEGLGIVRAMLPPTAPFRAWSNLEFRDAYGKWHEVDLVVLGRRRLHLVELKYYTGPLRGDDLTWRRDGHRAEDSPLKLARRKAQRLASKLQDELVRWAQETGAAIPEARTVVPFVQEGVFLHHPGIRCLLPTMSRIDLFGLDGHEQETGLPGISERLLEPPTQHQAVGANRDDIIAALMARIGIVQRRQREAGSWVIDEEPLGEGDGWQGWPAFHRVATTERGRIRFLVTPPGATATTRAKVRQVAEHEYRVMSRLASDRLLRPRDLVDSDLGVGLVYPLDDRFQRLDLWLADHAGSVPATEQLSLLRQVAEAVAYAHGNRVVYSTSFDSHIAIGPCVTASGVMAAIAGTWSQSFPATPDQVREARQFLRRLLGDWPRGDDALACLSELASNSVLHSNSRRPGGYFAVHVSLWPGMLRVAVEDEGGSWKHLHGGDDQRRRVLVIVERLASNWSVIGNGAGARTVWFEISHP